MKTTFIFIRHAKSAAADAGIVQGKGLSVSLTKEGEAQAAILARALVNVSFDRLFSSTAVRAVKTASYVRAVKPSIVYEEIIELHERSKGEAEGMTKEAFNRVYPAVLTKWAAEEDTCVAGGESFADVEKRVLPIIESHAKLYRGKRLLYVIHGNVIRVLLGMMLGAPPGLRARIAQDYCALSVAEYDDERCRWKVRTVNAPADSLKNL
jgi:probable phosphoglycerate mutase